MGTELKVQPHVSRELQREERKRKQMEQQRQRWQRRRDARERAKIEDPTKDPEFQKVGEVVQCRVDSPRWLTATVTAVHPLRVQVKGWPMSVAVMDYRPLRTR